MTRTDGSTRTLPPPWVWGSIALGPISAMLRTLALQRQETASVAQQDKGSRRALAQQAGIDERWRRLRPGLPLKPPSRRARAKSRETLSSTSASGTAPSRTAATSVAPRPVRPGHDEIEPGERARHGRGRGGPVGDDHAGESPIRLEQVVQQDRVGGHGWPVDRVVRGHHQEHAGFGDACFKRRQVQLPQHALGNSRVVGPALGLRIVGHVVLRGGANTRPLHTAHISDGDARGEQRVFGEAFEAAPAERGADDVDGRGEKDVDALDSGFLSERGRELLDEVDVPGRGEGDRAGQRGGWIGRIEACAADPGRAVGNHASDAARPRSRRGAPKSQRPSAGGPSAPG